MAINDLIPWNRGRDVSVRRGEELNPFLMLHRQVNRPFDDMFRGFNFAPLSTADCFFDRGFGWPNIKVSETNKEAEVTAELPGLDEKDVDVQLANGVLTIRGEKKTETEDKDRRLSERFYGHFERRIPIDDIDEAKVTASFKNGVLTVTFPKTAAAGDKVKRIAIKAGDCSGSASSRTFSNEQVQK